MLISELIKILEQFRAEYGEIECLYDYGLEIEPQVEKDDSRDCPYVNLAS